MKAALITIGNELLSGFTVDTNAAWIGQELGKAGVPVIAHLTVGDNQDQIISALRQLETDVSIIIVTGGLGPTHDDVTPSAFYSYFNAQPVFDEPYWESLKQRFARANLVIPEINRNQAIKPDKGNVISNPVGSARGLHFEKNSKHYFAIPGVPREMKGMMHETILPWIVKQVLQKLHIRTLRTTGIPESALAEKLAEIVDQYSGEIAFLPQIIGVDIRISSQDIGRLNNLERQISTIAKKYIFGTANTTLEEAVGNLLKKQTMTVATAESCTGGLLGHRITNVPGSSQYMLGGVVTYSNTVKMSLLGVKQETLDRVGAVSEETAGEMATGIKDLLKSDIGVSITGIAGPAGGTQEKPVGLVYIGIAIHDQVNVKKFNFLHNRETNKLLSSQVALNMIRLALQND